MEIRISENWKKKYRRNVGLFNFGYICCIPIIFYLLLKYFEVPLIHQNYIYYGERYLVLVILFFIFCRYAIFQGNVVRRNVGKIKEMELLNLTTDNAIIEITYLDGTKERFSHVWDYTQETRPYFDMEKNVVRIPKENNHFEIKKIERK